MIVYRDMLQGSEAWERVRRGRPTASSFDRFITTEKGELSRNREKTGLSQAARAYVAELIAEAICPAPAAFTGTAWTDRGLELEAEARQAFSSHTGLAVEAVGFCALDARACSPGASPDGLIPGADGEWLAGLEIKVPAPKTHIGYLMDGVLPDDYKRQVHGGMAVTGLSQWHFFSYLPGIQPLHIIVHRDDYTERLGASLNEFLAEYATLWEQVIGRAYPASNGESE